MKKLILLIPIFMFSFGFAVPRASDLLADKPNLHYYNRQRVQSKHQQQQQRSQRNKYYYQQEPYNNPYSDQPWHDSMGNRYYYKDSYFYDQQPPK